MFAVLLAWLLFVNVQQTELSGRVCDATDGGPLPGAIVRLVDLQEATLAYAMTDAEGNFRIRKDSRAVAVCVALLGYQEARLPVPSDPSCLILLNPSTEQIQEAVVQANKVKMAGDTVSFNINALKTREDYVLGDALKRLPGIEVGDNGRIRVDGREISQLQIDGRDVLGTNYDLAVRKLNVNAVASVDVVRGFQRIKMLRELQESDDAILNIRLNGQAKNQANLGGSASGGWQQGYSELPLAAELSVFSLHKLFSTVDEAGYDSEGQVMKDLATTTVTEIRPAQYQVRERIGVSPVSAPVGARGKPFNRTVSARSVDTWTPSDEVTIRADVSYLFDRQESRTKIVSTYHEAYGENQTRVRTENRMVKNHHLQGGITYQGNHQKLYFLGKLGGMFDRDAGQSGISGDLVRTSLTDASQWDVYNTLSFKFATGEKLVLGVDSYTQFAGRGERMDLIGMDLSQTVGSRFLWQDLSVSGLAVVRERWNFSMKPVFLWRYAANSGRLDGMADTIVPGVKFGDRESVAFSAGLTWDISWRWRNLRIGLDGKCHFDRIRSGDYVLGSFFPDATLQLRYETGRWEWEIMAGIEQGMPEIQTLGDFLILTDYDRLDKGTPNVLFLPQGTASMRVLYREPVSGWNIRASSHYAQSAMRLGGRDLLGDYILTYQTDETAEVRSVTSSVELTKGLYAINGKVTASAGHNYATSKFVQNGFSPDYSSGGWNLSLEVSAVPFRFWNLSLSARHNWSRMQVETLPTNAMRSFSLQMKNTFYLSDALSAGFSGDVWYNSSVDRAHYFADGFLEWKVGKSVRIKLMANNLFNVVEYAYSTQAALLDTDYTCRIHPRTILLGIVWNR